MKKRYLIFMLVSLLLTLKVSAASSPQVNNVTLVKDDIVKVNITKGTNDIGAIYVCETQDLHRCIKYPTNNIEAYASVPNGTYYITAADVYNNEGNYYPFTMTTSCFVTGVTNVKDSGTRTMCGIMGSNGKFENMYKELELATCADGYILDTIQTQMLSTTCKYNTLDFNTYGLSKRLCKNEYKYVCVPNKSTTIPVNVDSSLKSLSLSNGTITPKFSSGTYSYAATVNSGSVTINASLKDSKASFADGYGPRTVNLKYGSNTFYVKVNGSKQTTYTIKITRPQEKNNSVNTLSSLSLSNGSLSPKFNSYTNNYSVTVNEDVSSVTISATLTDAKSSFVKGFEPRVVKLDHGLNVYYVKVKSQTGNVRVYKLSITRKGGETPAPKPDDVVTPDPQPVVSGALLNSITLSSGNITFEPMVFDYNVTVDNNVTSIVATVEPQNQDDKVEITGGENLLDGENEVAIKVTSSDGSVSNTYTIYVIRKSLEEEISSNSLLKNITIAGHKLKFDAKKTDYTVTLNEGETSLELQVEPASDKATVSIEGNENLTTGSEIKIRVTAESGEYTDYYLSISGYKKSGNVFLTIILILVIVLVLAYLVLRLLGYKIYFNFEGIKNWFSNLFTRKK